MKKYIAFVVLMFSVAFAVLFSGLVFSAPVAVGLFVCGVIADFATTYWCLKVSGQEGNPVIAFLFRKIGVLGAFALLGVLWTFVVIFRIIPAPENIQTAIAFAYWLVPINNLLVTRRLILKKREASKTAAN